MSGHPLPEHDADARAMAERIFREDRVASTLAPVVSEFLPTRALGFPFYQHDLTSTQWRNFTRALRDCGVIDTEAFAAVLFTMEGHWRFRLDDTTPPYQALKTVGWPSIFESAIYSIRGEWALAVADEDFAVAAGPAAFVRALQERMTEFQESSVREFVLNWRSEVADAPPDSPPRLWVPAVLEHVYGSRADSWLRLFRGEDM